jgi:hypothetical protein
VGTNYYWRHNICFCCNRSDEWHICKSLISFEGHFSEGEWDDAAKAWPDGQPGDLVATVRGRARAHGWLCDNPGPRKPARDLCPQHRPGRKT